jgi:hypothetical protein
MSVDAVSDLDLSYTPPLGSPWDRREVTRLMYEKHQWLILGLREP